MSTFFWSSPKQNGKNQFIPAGIDFVRSNPTRISTIESLQELNSSSFAISSDIWMENMGKPLFLLEAKDNASGFHPFDERIVTVQLARKLDPRGGDIYQVKEHKDCVGKTFFS